MGSFDRHVRPDEPDRPDRRDPDRRHNGADQPSPPRETEAQLAERLGLSGLTRAAAYESLYAKAHAQDAPFRERLAREEREESAKRRESLTEPADSPSPQDPPNPPTDRPEHNPETTRNYWTEVPRFLALWRSHVEKWPWSQPQRADRPMDPKQRAESAESVRELPKAEPPISDNVKAIETTNSQGGWLAGYEFRLKGQGRLMDKVADRLVAESDRKPGDIVREIPDAIRYTFCFKSENYSTGYFDTRRHLEGRGYTMYQCKNLWTNPEYKGVNTRWVTSEGQRFEVQFHTRESFHAKHDVTHNAYERARSPNTSRAELADIEKFQREVSSWIPVPNGIEKIKDYKEESS